MPPGEQDASRYGPAAYNTPDPEYYRGYYYRSEPAPQASQGYDVYHNAYYHGDASSAHSYGGHSTATMPSGGGSSELNPAQPQDGIDKGGSERTSPGPEQVGHHGKSGGHSGKKNRNHGKGK